jgi:polysaccharide pyruvyl transferase WcaK-like protein
VVVRSGQGKQHEAHSQHERGEALADVPFLPLPYASKVEGFLSELRMPASRVHDLNVGRLLANIDRAWDMRDELRSRVKEHVPPLIERAGKTVDFAADLVRSALPAALQKLT